MITKMIDYAKTLHDKYEFLHGGCYAFAKAMSEIFNGEVLINRELEHCIVRINEICYDITGVVKNTTGYHPFRPKEEIKIKKEYFLIKPEYTDDLISMIKSEYDRLTK
jgi:hypothetical protein